ncbi:MAG: YraN family protein [Chloroflexi bacterium]|nr:YraN family protein [Chloroflexota bacterium]
MHWPLWSRGKPQLPFDRKKLGSLGEQLAAKHLKKNGYRIIERNYHCREGEIDIVARQKNTLVFVEVRTKTGLGYGTPEESVTRAKKQKMAAAAFRYLRTNGNPEAEWRIDLVAVQFDRTGKLTRIEIIENAVGG